MRPIELKMQAFGPYRDFIHLDFTKFGNHSIFLVNGPTGSGKTTIFDAISYALFNKASGENRENDMMKSDFATDEELAYVELTFEMKNTIYRVKRSPKQKGPGERVKVRNYQSNVEFYREDEYLANGTEANGQIVELLGLSHEQFKQIVLLPQGEFRKLLVSDSKDKEKIFRNIFATQKIEDFQEYLKSQRKKYKKEYEIYETRLKQNVETIDLKSIDNKNEEEFEELEEAIRVKDYKEVLILMSQLLEEEKTSYDQLKEKLKDLNTKEKNYEEFAQLLLEKENLENKKEELLNQAEDIQKSKNIIKKDQQARALNKEVEQHNRFQKEFTNIIEKIEEKTKREKELTDKIKELEEEEKISKSDEQKLDRFQKDLRAYDLELKKFEEIEENKQSIKEAEESKKRILSQREKLEEKEKGTLERIQFVRSDLEKIVIWREELEEKRLKNREIEQIIEQEKQKKKTLEEIIKLQNLLKKMIEDKQSAYKDYQSSEKKYRSMQESYFSNLAGILAKDLSEKEACPVCGSKNHPKLASSNDGSISKEKLAELEKIREEKQIIYKEIEIKIQKTTESIEEKLELLEEKIAQSEMDQLSEKLSITKKEYLDKKEENKEIVKEIEKIEEKIKKESSWRKELEELQEYLQEKKLILTELTKDFSNAELKIKEKRAKIHFIEEKLEAESAPALSKKIEALELEIKRIEERAKSLQKELNELYNERTAIKATLKSLKERQKEVAKEEKEQKEIVSSLFKDYGLEKDFIHFILKQNEIEELKEKIQLYEKEKDYTIRQLEKTINGLKGFEDSETKNPQEIKNYLEDLAIEKESLEEKRDEMIQKISSHESSEEKIRKNLKESKDLQKPYEIYSDLAEVASGSTKRTSFVSFERYLLSIYFSEILSAANERFVKMTNNRYKLIRRKNKTKGQSAEGLELNVFDRYSGKERSVKTLSGGETFKASLALALGLSDVIQNQQGGVEINTLFIDEGFGSLDIDSLEIAIETLMELQSSGRLIGIISHVEELKNRIPARILVENLNEGSHARIEID